MKFDGVEACKYAAAAAIVMIACGITTSMVIKAFHTFMKAQSLLC